MQIILTIGGIIGIVVMMIALAQPRIHEISFVELNGISRRTFEREIDLQLERMWQRIRVVQATVTAYSSTTDQTDRTPFEMANGQLVHDGAIACPRRYPFGTTVYIGAKRYTCTDRMSRRYDDRFDIWFPTRSAALVWGKQERTVFIAQ
ncbi:MAG: 3D domain-containing protein [Candidatus Eisenbacteria bacterium]|nr:3D domain-containing protein [Candidatus Eisenbacteria bacterium]